MHSTHPPQLVHIKGSRCPQTLWTTHERTSARPPTVAHVEVPSGVRFGPKGKGATAGGCWGSCAYGRRRERCRRGPIATLTTSDAESRRQNGPHSHGYRRRLQPAADLREHRP